MNQLVTQFQELEGLLTRATRVGLLNDNEVEEITMGLQLPIETPRKVHDLAGYVEYLGKVSDVLGDAASIERIEKAAAAMAKTMKAALEERRGGVDEK